jgi:hypothetical protein
LSYISGLSKIGKHFSPEGGKRAATHWLLEKWTGELRQARVANPEAKWPGFHPAT